MRDIWIAILIHTSIGLERRPMRESRLSQIHQAIWAVGSSMEDRNTMSKNECCIV
jgi:hypothetical protein